MNLLLLRSGYPPAIVHSTERQRYYDALKGSSAAMTQIVQEAIDNNLASVEKLLETHESRSRRGSSRPQHGRTASKKRDVRPRRAKEPPAALGKFTHASRRG